MNEYLDEATMDFEAAPRCTCKGDSAEVGAEAGDLEASIDFGEDLEVGDFETGTDAPDFEVDLEGTDAATDYELWGKDTRVRVTQTTAAPFRYICNLEYTVSGGLRRGACTGTLIGSRTVLTAGHCLSGTGAATIRVIPGRNGSLEPLPATLAVRSILYPGYAGATPTDIGILHLKDPIGNKVGWWTRQYARSQVDPIGRSISARPLPLPAGRLKVNVSGYPGDMPADPNLACRSNYKSATCSYSPFSNPKRSPICGAVQYCSYDQTVQPIRTSTGVLLRYMNDTCKGHSGSPVWVKRSPDRGGRVLVGVHIGRSTNSNMAVRITPSVLAWIARNTI